MCGKRQPSGKRLIPLSRSSADKCSSVAKLYASETGRRVVDNEGFVAMLRYAEIGSREMDNGP